MEQAELTQEEFCQLISITMMEHPDWVPAIYRAVMEGSQLAIDALELKASKYRGAVTAALILSMSKAGIKNPKIREACVEQVLDAIKGDKNSCKLDKEYAKEFLLETLEPKEIEELLQSMKSA